MKLVFLGAPGAGKGTQAKRISKQLGISHISTGDILRDELKNNSQLGLRAAEYMHKGELVPDELIIEMIKNILTENACSNNTGFLLDGFPRTLNQAIKFEEMLSGLGLEIDRVINIDVDDEELVKRLSGRRVCHDCSNMCSINGVRTGDPVAEGKCPVCGGALFQRKDDERDVIMRRLHIYQNQTKPLVDYYSGRKLLANVDGSGSEEEIAERIISIL